MTARSAALLLLANAAISTALIASYVRWVAPPRPPTLAVLDLGELYRLKEAQVTAILVNRDTSPEARAEALKRASGFNREINQLIDALPDECRCLLLARGAVIGPAPLLSDLTPEIRRRLGL